MNGFRWSCSTFAISRPWKAGSLVHGEEESSGRSYLRKILNEARPVFEILWTAGGRCVRSGGINASPFLELWL